MDWAKLKRSVKLPLNCLAAFVVLIAFLQVGKLIAYELGSLVGLVLWSFIVMTWALYNSEEGESDE